MEWKKRKYSLPKYFALFAKSFVSLQHWLLTNPLIVKFCFSVIFSHEHTKCFFYEMYLNSNCESGLDDNNFQISQKQHKSQFHASLFISSILMKVCDAKIYVYSHFFIHAKKYFQDNFIDNPKTSLLAHFEMETPFIFSNSTFAMSVAKLLKYRLLSRLGHDF